MSEKLRSPWLRCVPVGLLVAGIVCYAAFLWRYVSPYAGGSDSSGYLNSARLLAQGRFFAEPRVLPGFSAREFGEFSHVPLGFVLRGDDQMAPTYPIGYPLQLLVAAGFGWSRAVTVLNVCTVIGSGWILFAYCRKLGISKGLAVGGVGLLWACPLFIFSAIQPMSDLSALGWSLVILYSALKAREGRSWGILCGAALGFAVLVRPTNLLLGVPLLVALGFHYRSWLAVAIGGLPSAVFFGYYNARLYGSPWTTGYRDVSGLFRWEYLWPNLLHFSHWIPVLLSPLIVLGLAAPFVAGARQRGAVVLAAWAATLISFYAFYFHSGETWWYLRFILPAFPALIVAVLFVLEAIWRVSRPRSMPAVTVGLALLLMGAIGWQARQLSRLDVLHLEINERSYPQAARWAKNNLPAESAIFCMQVSGAFFYYTDFLLFRWEQVAPEKYNGLLETIARQNRPVYAALYAFETAEAFGQIGGHWTKLATVGQVTFWQREP